MWKDYRTDSCSLQCDRQKVADTNVPLQGEYCICKTNHNTLLSVFFYISSSVSDLADVIGTFKLTVWKHGNMLTTFVKIEHC